MKRFTSNIMIVIVCVGCLLWFFPGLRQPLPLLEKVRADRLNLWSYLKGDHEDGELLNGADAYGTLEAGEDFRVELIEAPNSHYGQYAATEADLHYRRLLPRDAPFAYDAALGHAARELAAFHALEGELAPSEVLSFFLDAAGAAIWNVEQSVLITTSEGDETIAEQLERLAARRQDAEGRVWVGIGESYRLGRPAKRHIAFLHGLNPMELDPVARELEIGESLHITGKVASNIHDLSVVVMGSDLEIRQGAVRMHGQRFECHIPAGMQHGPVAVEIIGTSEQGPKPLAQLDFHVDEDLPWELDTHWPLDESQLRNPAEAEEFAWTLINRDRQRFGLARVARSPALDKVARSHSFDMGTHDFFAHVSPTTGSVGDRLRHAGLRTVVHAENIARNQTLEESQRGLMRSLGHRRNILLENVTEVGVGVYRIGEGDGRQWALTQVFARPEPVIEPDAARDKVLEALRIARIEAGLDPLEQTSVLKRLASEEAATRNPTPSHILERSGPHLRRGGWAWVAKVAELDGLEVPEKVLDARYRLVGVGIHQHLDQQSPNIVVVLLVGG